MVRLYIEGSTGKAAIYETTSGDAPFTTPLSHIDKLYFHSDLDAISVQTVHTGTVTLPSRAQNGEYNATQNLFAHGLGGIPYVEGRLTKIGGTSVSVPLCGSVCVYKGSGSEAGAFARWVHLGADATNVMLSEYTTTHLDTGGFGSLALEYEVYVTDLLLT